MARWLVISGILLVAAPPAWAQQPKAYNLPRVDLKQRFIWDSQCEGANGFVLAPDDGAAWAEAMLALGGDDDRWEAMRAASRVLAPAGDTQRFAEGVAALI